MASRLLSECCWEDGWAIGMQAGPGVTQSEIFFSQTPRWLSKSDILAHVDIPDSHWNTAINDLLARGAVERQGERRSARYRYANQGVEE
jgi:hypothetical protein